MLGIWENSTASNMRRCHMTDIRYMSDGSGLLDVEDLEIMRQIESMSMEEIEASLRADGVDVERFERELREKIAAKRKELQKMSSEETKDLGEVWEGETSRQIEEFKRTQDAARQATSEIRETMAVDPLERSPKLQEMDQIRRDLDFKDGELEGAIARGEETALREAMFEILLHVKDAPLTAESAQEILERHGLEGLMVLVSDDQPEIQEETAAIENLFDDLIDRDALSRELST